MSHQCVSRQDCCVWEGDWRWPPPCCGVEYGRGGSWVCLLPGNEAISKVHNLFMFLSSVFVRRIDSKLLFLRPYHGSQRGETQSNSVLQQYSTKQYNQAAIISHPKGKSNIFLSSNPPLMLAFLSPLPPKASLSYWMEWKDFSQVLTLGFATRPVAHLKASCGGNSSSTPSVI